MKVFFLVENRMGLVFMLTHQPVIAMKASSEMASPMGKELSIFQMATV